MTNGARKHDPGDAPSTLTMPATAAHPLDVAASSPSPSQAPAESSAGESSAGSEGATADSKAQGDVHRMMHAIPIRRRASVDGAPLRAAFLLSHVDHRMTVAQLAACAQIPVHDAIECFELLADLGVVELRMPDRVSDAPEARPVSKSGLRPKT